MRMRICPSLLPCMLLISAVDVDGNFSANMTVLLVQGCFCTVNFNSDFQFLVYRTQIKSYGQMVTLVKMWPILWL